LELTSPINIVIEPSNPATISAQTQQYENEKQIKQWID